MADGTNPDSNGPSDSVRGRYRRWFAEAAPEELPSDDALQALADAMTLPDTLLNEGPNPHESGIPAAYTYLGQFVAHDLSGDPGSADPDCPGRPATVSTRTPLLDLDALYGLGLSAVPARFDAEGRFILGAAFTAGSATLVRGSDFRRAKNPSSGPPAVMPLIADERNDGHRILAQVHDVFMRFHNRVFELEGSFEATRREMCRYYQWLILHDFLPKIVHGTEAADAPGAPVAFREFLTEEAYTPVEFAAAVFRFGHSMVRAGYRLNTTLASSFKISLPDNRAGSLNGFSQPLPTWGIDWNLFIDLSDAPRDWDGQDRVQLAHQIDTVLVNPLGSLPAPLRAPSGAGANLALRNLRRGRGLRLASGQSVARALGLEPLGDDRILVGVDKKPIRDVHASLAGNCPLWLYTLAEAIPEQTDLQTVQGTQSLTTRKLGPVAGRIVRKTIRGLLQVDRESVLNTPDWRPNSAFTSNGKFGLAELLRAALPKQS